MAKGKETVASAPVEADSPGLLLGQDKMTPVGDGVLWRVTEVAGEGVCLVLVVPLTGDYGLSGSGKSRNIGTTRGACRCPGAYSDVRFSLNVYRTARK